jgi:hypothetical protein
MLLFHASRGFPQLSSFLNEIFDVFDQGVRCLCEELRKVSFEFVVTVRLSIRPHGRTRLPLDGVS